MTRSGKRVRMPPKPARTEAEERYSANNELYIADERSAAVHVTDQAITVAGCKGKGCTRGHGKHLADITEALRMLVRPEVLAGWGIPPEPPAVTAKGRHYHWGAAS